jgi:HK97 family phage prohead protease
VRLFVGLDEWKLRTRAGEAPTEAILRKQYIPDLVKDAGARKVTFVISTGSVDRERDTLRADGWHLDAYRRNPVVLWGHQSRDLPIGTAESIGTSAGVLKATARFAEPGKDYQPDEWPSHLPTPDTVLSMIRGGFLRATSVGFMPVRDKAKWNEERGGVDFEEQELLEFSIVPVPANAEALVEAKAAGLDVAPFVEQLKRCLDSFEPGCWVAKEQAEAALRAIAAPRIVVPELVGKVLDFAIVIGKRGRVLSQANEDRLRAARDAGAEGCALLEEVLTQVAAAPPEPSDEAAAAPKAAPVLFMAPSEPTYAVDPSVVRAAVMAAVTETVVSQINEARGRLD